MRFKKWVRRVLLIKIKNLLKGLEGQKSFYSMEGKIIKYIEQVTPYSPCLEYRAIVIGYRRGYSIRKSWSNKSKFVECPMVRLYWLNEPPIKPYSALSMMTSEWNVDPQYSFGFIHNSNNYVIDDIDEFKSEWYYASIFEIVKDF